MTLPRAKLGRAVFAWFAYQHETRERGREVPRVIGYWWRRARHVMRLWWGVAALAVCALIGMGGATWALSYDVGFSALLGLLGGVCVGLLVLEVRNCRAEQRRRAL